MPLSLSLLHTHKHTRDYTLSPQDSFQLQTYKLDASVEQMSTHFEMQGNLYHHDDEQGLSCCDTLQHTATHCNILQHTLTCKAIFTTTTTNKVYLRVCVSLCLSMCLSVRLSVCLSVCIPLSVCLSVCASVST